MKTALLVAAALLLVAGLVAIGLLLRARARKRAAARAAAAAADPGVEIRRAFAAARKILGATTADAAARDAVPRFLLLGEPGVGKSTLIAGAGLKPRAGQLRPLGDPAGCQIWLFDKGTVIEPSGRMLVGEAREGQAPDAAGFRALLEAARSDRPERPIDGILVALSCRDLAGDGSEPAPDLRRRAAILQQRIATAEQALGMVAPVAMILTQGDRLRGFQSFADEIDPQQRQGVLGWSSSLSPTVAGSANEVDDALESMREALNLEQARRLAAERSFRGAAGAEDYFLFPAALEGLREPLRACFEELFLAASGAEPPALRGVYLAGLGGAWEAVAPAAQGPPPEAGPQAAGAAGPAGVEPPVLFARELFERKIFPEANLARPSRAAIRKRDRLILALRIATPIAALLYGGLLSLESSRVERDAASLLPFLNDLSSDLIQMKLEDPGADPSGAARVDRSIQLFKGLDGVEGDRLRSVIVPGSWLSSVDRRVEGAIATAYKSVILDAFRAALHAKTGPLLAEAPAPAGAQIAAATLEKTPEYVLLEGWLREVSAFEASAARFDALASGPPQDRAADEGALRLQSVADLSDYLFRHKLAPGRTSAFHRRALTRIPQVLPFGIETYREQAQARSDHLFEQLFRRVSRTLNEEALRADVDALIKGLDTLDQGGPEYRFESLSSLHQAIVRTQGHLAAPTLSWVASEGLPPNPAIDRLLEAVRVSRLLGTSTHAYVKDDGEARLLLLKSYLGNAETSLTGPVLARKEGVAQLELTPFITSLRDPAGGLLRQGFMEPTDEEDPLPEDLDAARLSWDIEALKATAKLLKDYEAFAQDGFKPFPEKVRPTLMELSLRSLKDNVLVGVGKAARREIAPPSSEARLIETVRTDVNGLALAREPLREMLAAAGRLRLDDVRDRLRALVRGQGARLLTQSTRVLQADALYEAKNGSFAWWNGEGTPAFEAFGVIDAARLGEYVIAQRGRADSLNRALAEPVLGLLESAEVGAETQPVEGMAIWQSVAGALRDYENKKAGNSLAALERFLVTDLPAITFENCLPVLDSAASDVSAGDYFTQRRRRIRGLLRDQCAALAGEEIRSQYPRLRRFFTRSLSDHFPFAKLEPGVQHPDAQPDDVRAFLQSSNDFRKRYRGVLAMRGDPGAKAVVRFLDRMEKVRAFLEPIWGQGESASEGTVDVDVDFRVNQGREVGGNQIAEWSFRFADERIFLGGPKSTSPWRLGDPVKLQLRWAKNSPDIPAEEQEPEVVVKERTVSFEGRGTWALLRLIAAHKSSAEDPERKEDSTSNILQLVIVTKPDPAGGMIDPAGASGGVARVFVRLALTGKEKDKPLKYPEFPTTAPALERGE